MDDYSDEKIDDIDEERINKMRREVYEITLSLGGAITAKKRIRITSHEYGFLGI
ncbi:hypothetical protein KAS56_03625 [candidate division WOR-3 bacterium]|nr:hypothetical protein [candidate division WOR-3 bacterium]